MLAATYRRARVAGALLALAGAACATNPATGRRQISLVSERQEIEMGRQADQEISAAVGVYEDPGLQSYVQTVGGTLAAASERKELGWTFRVLDDAAVNAMALPGGYVYVTRGILTHMNSEAELAGVLGHEAGHITARHTVNRITQSQLAGLGLVLGMILSPQLRNYGNLAEVGMGLLFLKYNRNDERQADELALRYLARTPYSPEPMNELFTVLERQGEESRGRLPNWLSTHPSPEDRRARIAQQIRARTDGAWGNVVRRSEYLARIDGMVFGEDPREGFFSGTAFYHPEMRFKFEFPRGWQTSNQKQAVGATSPQRDAVVVITLTGRNSPAEASREFFSQQNVRQGQAWRGEINGLRADAHSFQALTQQGELRGLVAFIEHGGRVFQTLGYAPASRWGRHEPAVSRSLGSFARLTERRFLEVQPARLEVVNLPRPMSLREFAERYPSTSDLSTLAVINHVFDQNGQLPAGPAKRVVGGRLPAGAQASAAAATRAR